MDEVKDFNFFESPDLPPIEDEATLAAIAEGIEDAKAGRVFTPEQVRQHLAQWIASLSTRNGR